ncbi:Glycoside hydrolase, catalytic domain-containing protein [Cynara cardunculus var. scolymus]|uniref:Glycoside hydrolase, catalytic domain-containing protein n=1 Tax=Cynara cardunculus var. scolymus TaxID=59895 RepID=A0A124SBN0_CYNCS|nr:Glycoside hydrolase, catalytic domain-containing protein [Cynara cardunculus var. scolymus]
MVIIVDKINGGSNACVTVDSYSRVKEDVQLLKKMGVNSYRFSISWSRILPGGKACMGKNQEGINYYNKVIDELLANDIEPFVTIFHWDVPNALEEEYMGFLSSKIVDDFVCYADICFWEFGDRVKNWFTLNEPHMFTYNGYVTGAFAPGRGEKSKYSDFETEPYTVAYNLLNCHAAAYRKYEKDYKSFQKGKVGITLDLNFCKPARGPNNLEDVKAVDYAFDFVNGWFLEPLAKGTWPETMQKFATAPTANYPKGRTLPEFSDDQRIKLIDSYDCLGVNYYTAFYAQYQAPSDDIPPGYTRDCHFKASGSPDMGDCKKTYEEVRDDTYRVEYIKSHFVAIRTAMQNNVNVIGYFYWSFMDSFEWSSGYDDRFGMIYVDYKNNLQRYPKNSALWFIKFLSEKKEGPLKRARMDGEEKDEVNDAMVEAEKPTGRDMIKLKKAKA